MDIQSFEEVALDKCTQTMSRLVFFPNGLSKPWNMASQPLRQRSRRLRGASIVMYMVKVSMYTKTIFCWVERLKVVAKCCLNWVFDSKLIAKSISQNGKCLSSGLDMNFKALINLKLNFFIFFEFIIDWRYHYNFIEEKHQLYVILSCFENILNYYVFNISTCTLLALYPKICRLFLKTKLAT